MRFAHPPVVQPLERFQLSEGRTLAGQLNYYDFGVVCAQLELPFDFEWDELVRFSSRWIEAPEIESKIAERIRECMGCVGGAMVNPYPGWLVEDYYVIHLLPIAGVKVPRA